MTSELRPAVEVPPETGWLIYKSGRGWYRPNAQGYTNSPAEAGRYSREKALSYSHPNGLDGPRDGMAIFHESEVPGALPSNPSAELAKWKALAETLAGALGGSIGSLEFSRDYHKDLGNKDQAFAQDRLDAATQALREYKEARDAS